VPGAAEQSRDFGNSHQRRACLKRGDVNTSYAGIQTASGSLNYARQAVAISLQAARRKEDLRLARLVRRIARETGNDPDDRPHRQKLADPVALRGIPCVGPLGGGSAIRGSVPGTGPLFDDDE
jgi:hypothetical protein